MSRCKECMSLYHKEIYKKSPERRAKILNLNKKNIQRNIDWVKNYKQQRCCLDCGNSNWIVLEFDHLRDKEDTVSKMVFLGYSLNKIQKEIEKCEIVCSNCHTIRTYNRRNIQG